MKTLMMMVMGIILLFVAGGAAYAQPAPTMYTLDNIYYYLAQGTEATWGAHSLDPQSGVPGEDIDGFTKSMEDIYYYMSDAFSQCSTTTPENVIEGYYFFCVDSNYWGVQEGTRQLTFYNKYGPFGTGDVVQIGSMYVASVAAGPGCASNGTKEWAAACSWATSLDWLGENTGWRLPTRVELSTICSDKGSLGSYQSDRYWSSTAFDASFAYNVYFSNCQLYASGKTNDFYVRVVRISE